MTEEFEKAKNKLNEYNQQHLLKFYDELDDNAKRNLLNQVNSIDFDLMSKLFKNKDEISFDSEEDKITPIKCDVLEELSNDTKEELYQLGLSLLSNGVQAVVTMAGGQGTRLGHDGPKGTYDIGLPSHKSLFELECDQLKASKELTGKAVPWYIMTSEENNNATIEFFEKNNYFDYGKENVVFFIQNMLPMLDTNGKLILSDKGVIKTGPNGHGGVFESLNSSGALADMENKGIEWVFICGVDNCLMKMADPIFLGYTKKSGKLASSKPILKRSPDEKAGVFCKKNGKPFVVEYTEISDEMANLKDEQGNYVYGDAHILGNMFNIELLKDICNKGLPYHTAFKKAAYINDVGQEVNPTQPNAYKFEMFLFDAFAFLEDIALLRVKREDEFAPVKNKEGEDSPETARALYLAQNSKKD